MPNPVLQAISRSTKLIATIGPASTNPTILRAMIAAGVDVVRCNFSHGSHADHLSRMQSVRYIARELQRPVALLQDLCGPKIRTTPTEDDRLVQLLPGDTFTIVSSNEVKGSHTAKRTGTTYTQLAAEVRPGNRILLSDGLISLRVKHVNGIDVVCEVQNGGALKGSQGINLPGVTLGVEAVTDKDLDDLKFGIENNIDWVAISFVRTAADVMRLRKEINVIASQRNIPKFKLPRVMAKIEKPEAVERIHEIIDVVDGIMVARGDLGVEMAPQEVPIVQKRIVAACNQRGLPVVVATQMLESMIEHPRPTRAEVSDVCNAIFDGADACMLSGESAAGAYPLEAVQMMAEIAQTARANPDVDTSIAQQELLQPIIPGIHTPFEESPQLGLGKAAVTLASTLRSKAIVTFTVSGLTALMVAKYRPQVPIIAFTRSLETARQLNLSRNIIPLYAPEQYTITELSAFAVDFVKREGIAATADTIVLTASHPLVLQHKPTNFLKVITI